MQELARNLQDVLQDACQDVLPRRWPRSYKILHDLPRFLPRRLAKILQDSYKVKKTPKSRDTDVSAGLERLGLIQNDLRNRKRIEKHQKLAFVNWLMMTVYWLIWRFYKTLLKLFFQQIMFFDNPGDRTIVRFQIHCTSRVADHKRELFPSCCCCNDW